jgi:hypothetical protein
MGFTEGRVFNRASIVFHNMGRSLFPSGFVIDPFCLKVPVHGL